MGDHPLFSFFVRLVTRSCANGVESSGMTIERDDRPWGSFEVLAEGQGYKVKRIEVKPGHRLSLQMHQGRTEHWVVVVGEALVSVGEREVRLRANEDVLVPPRTKHRVANTSDAALVFIEVQCGSYLGEDDITRFEDDYSRTLPAAQWSSLIFAVSALDARFCFDGRICSPGALTPAYRSGSPSGLVCHRLWIHIH